VREPARARLRGLWRRAARHRARFCLQCGQAVATFTAAERSAAPETYIPRHLAEKILTSKAALEGERKQVTVLFADLKGSMELLADRDPSGMMTSRRNSSAGGSRSEPTGVAERAQRVLPPNAGRRWGRSGRSDREMKLRRPSR